MPAYARIAWRAKLMFDWAHLLHRQIYDAYADERLTTAQRDRLIEQLTDYYLSNRKYAFTVKPKSMALMDEQYFSQTFRKAYPKFNGLIWAYHWLQVGLYEPFLEEDTKALRKAAVQATVARFWSMLKDPPSRMPKMMPMTSAVAPKFSAAHPRAAVIFDNLHMMHDIISDILTADTIPHDQKGEMIDQQLDKLQDSTRDIMSMDEWRMMADHMGGVDAMGGQATNLVRAIESPVAAMGDHGRMGHDMGQMDRGHAMAADTLPHGKKGAKLSDEDTAQSGMAAHMAAMMDLHQRMMADSVIRRRMMADPEMRRLMAQLMDSVGVGPQKGQHEGHQARPTVPAGPDQEPLQRPKQEQPTKPAAPSDSVQHHQGHSVRVAPSSNVAARRTR
jgi:hypothetical protein